MPFGLPGLSADEHRALTRWLSRARRTKAPAPPTPLAMQRVAQWERFFNGDSLKERLFSRYAYEHLFLAHLYFDDDRERQYFRLVRSATPPGPAVATDRQRRPVDDPACRARVLPPRPRARDHRRQDAHALRAECARMARWRALFLDAPVRGRRLPGYSADTAANPFTTFAALPVAARYRFMLDEAEFTIMGFIKGPVCRGQMALNVIEDHFWVVFLAPSSGSRRGQSAACWRATPTCCACPPAAATRGLLPWLQYAKLEKEYLKAKSDARAALPARTRLDLRLIWDGDGRNENAALTVFRHFDSASVVKGLVGEAPKTAWVIGYPLLERIHYLLVADYDVYGNVGHQLNSRLYMDFLRMEGEFNFLSLLPQAQRLAARDHWYRGDSLDTREQVYGGPTTTLAVESAIRYRTSDPKRELLDMLKAKLAPVLNTRFDIDRRVAPPLRAPLHELERVRGASLQWLPESSLLVVEAPAGDITFSLLRNTAHASVSNLLGEQRELRPDEDTLTVVPGVIGSYPNAFYRVRAADLSAMAAAIRQLRSEADYASFAKRWAVRRTSPDFWAFSDALTARYRKDQAIDAGVLDYNRFETAR